MTALNYSEWETFYMTPRKLFKLFDEYQILKGYKKAKDEYAVDMLP